VSCCPHCQSELSQPDFCQACFRSLQAPPGGRFAALLEQGFASLTPSDLPNLGTDLMSVTFQPGAWKNRLMLPGLKQLASGLATLAVLIGGVGLYQHAKYLEAVRHRQNGQALTRQGDYQGARNQLQLAPDEPETHRALAELAVAEGKWEQAAVEFAKVGVNDSEVNRHLDEAALVRVQELLIQARLSKDPAQALGFSDQAEQLLKQHRGNSTQMARLHFLRAQLFQKLELRSEALAEVEQTLACDPRHPEAGRLFSLLKPRAEPAPAPEHHDQIPAARPQVEVPRLELDPGYPTYQPPEPEFPQYSSMDMDGESGPKAKRRRKKR
jgi:hypothetical protein